jgi:arylsulfatase A-like enzyme
MPLLIAGPGVRAGVTSSYPARLIDIAPTVLTLMGVPPRGMRGIPLADAMTSPTAAGRAAQGEVQRTLQPLVNSLKSESKLERAETR